MPAVHQKRSACAEHLIFHCLSHFPSTWHFSLDIAITILQAKSQVKESKTVFSRWFTSLLWRIVTAKRSLLITMSQQQLRTRETLARSFARRGGREGTRTCTHAFLEDAFEADWQTEQRRRRGNFSLSLSIAGRASQKRRPRGRAHTRRNEIRSFERARLSSRLSMVWATAFPVQAVDKMGRRAQCSDLTSW